MAEPAKRPVSFWVGCLVGCAAAACGIAGWIVAFLVAPDDDGYPLAVGIGIIVGVAVLVALALRRPTRRASLGMLVGVTAMMLATVAIKVLVYDYP
jgi:hypothetical protein